MFERLKKKWKITSNSQLAVIFLVFAITGSASAKLARPALDLLGINATLFEAFPFGMACYFLLRILIIFPIYQILLIGVGSLFFQFKFFWEFEKKVLKKIGLKFLFEKNEKDQLS
jgi:hypothetical protein